MKHATVDEAAEDKAAADKAAEENALLSAIFQRKDIGAQRPPPAGSGNDTEADMNGFPSVNCTKFFNLACFYKRDEKQLPGNTEKAVRSGFHDCCVTHGKHTPGLCTAIEKEEFDDFAADAPVSPNTCNVLMALFKVHFEWEAERHVTKEVALLSQSTKGHLEGTNLDKCSG